MQQYLHHFVVIGKGQFPFDMLRYDMCYPLDQLDVDGMLDPTNEPRRVTMVAVGPKSWQPTPARWSSFGWHIKETIFGYRKL